jgi:hypothetical protein
MYTTSHTPNKIKKNNKQTNKQTNKQNKIQKTNKQGINQNQRS